MPAISQAWRTVMPGSTSICRPSIVSFGMLVPLLRRLRLPIGRHAGLHLRAEMADQALDRPGGGVAQRADRVALDLAGDLLEKVDLRRRRIAFDHPLHHPPHPAGALAAGRPLAA